MCECHYAFFDWIFDLDWKSISSFSVAITVPLAYLSYRQSVKVSKFQLYEKVRAEIYNRDGLSYKTSKAIRENRIRHVSFDGKPVLQIQNLPESTWETIGLDLLHNLEDLGFYYSKGLISHDFLMHGFSDLLKNIKASKEIETFLDEFRKRNGKELFSELDSLLKLV